ncbi:fumarylacetoacetate hydrolase family protein [Haladaptatus sp. DYF46]|uniref:fumarylacetoacetate hydrolase family protein n=1 Tax=Haladaptatus sp. DYF46 TaxID=2886041 RepID=UPI001E52315D|nr:fumarylacetoacetate hydrolase family protein [Haladaptatus sp. DYF46]
MGSSGESNGMHICSFRHATASATQLGVVDDGIVSTIETESTSLDAALADGDDWDSLLERATGAEFSVDEITLESPVERPTNLVGIGLNYVGHAEEGGFDVPEEPVFFAKSPTSITAPESTVVKHPAVENLHYEGEFGVVVGNTLSRASPVEARDGIFGFTAGNDVTARDIQYDDLDAANPWYRSKSMATFTPLGPWVTPVSEGVDPDNASIETRLNGSVVQSSNTDDLVFDVGEALSYVSRFVMLAPGDVVLTGTPAGVGEMVPGDTVEVEVEGVGTLTNTVGSP